MPSTPTKHSPLQPLGVPPEAVDATERELVDMLQAALAPSFVLIRRVGAGGMGAVYLARDPALKRLVAVKVMRPDRAADPDARARFQREAEAVAAISHPNVVAVYSVGALANGLPYLVMQYVDGPSMAERLANEGPLDLESAKMILGQVASALGAAHRKGIIHRDIKAANILWDDTAGRALVTDFGIAGLLDRDYDTATLRLTQTGVVMGTPQYMSPEQLLSEPVTDKTDIYSLGLLGYEIMTGEGPYQLTSPNQIMAAHLRDAPRPLSTLRPDAGPELESLLAACLEKDAHGRPSAEDVARRLQHSTSILLEWPPPGLEDLQGAIARPLAGLFAGAFAVSIPLTMTATAGQANVLHLDWPASLLLPSVAAIGAVSVVIALVDGARLGRAAARAARAGYGWGTIAEVLADTRMDTGALISGDREYASLSASQRDTLRRGRVARVGLTLLASLWAAAGFFVALPFAVRMPGGPLLLASWSLGVPLALIIAARSLGWRESRMLAAVRSRIRRHRAPLERLSHLAGIWRDSFDRIRGGFGLGVGTVGRVKRRVLALAGATLLAVAGVTAAYGLIMVSVLGEYRQGFPPATAAQDRARRVARLQKLRPPIDPSVTPLRAGYAMQSLGFAPRTKALSPFEAPAKYPIGRFEFATVDPKAPFPDGFAPGNAMRVAAKGLTASQRAYLETRAAIPGAAELAILSRAKHIDWIAASLVQPLPAALSLYDLPLPGYSGVRTEAYAHSARAALALADGKPLEAERLARENIGVGFALMDGPTLLDNMIGSIIVLNGRADLVALYEATGRAAEARAISFYTDPNTEVVGQEADPSRMTTEERDAYYNMMFHDLHQPRGQRWRVVVEYWAYRPCGDLRQVLFGPDEAHALKMAEARRLLVRTEGENQLMLIAERSLDSPVTEASGAFQPTNRHRVLAAVARAVDLLSGSRRMASCVNFTAVNP